MSQEGFAGLDAEFAELLGEDAVEDANICDVQQITAEPAPAAHEPSKPTQPAVPLNNAAADETAATRAHHVTADDQDIVADVDSTACNQAQVQASKPPAGGMTAALSGGASKKPALAGRKRQLTVPSSASGAVSAATKLDATKARAATMQAPTETTTSNHQQATATASAATAAASATSPFKRPRIEDAAAAVTAAGGSADDSETMTAVVTEATAAVEEEDAHEAGEEEEVKSPMKTANSAGPEAAAASSDQAAHVTPAFGMKKSLVVAKATGPEPSETAADKATASTSTKTTKPPAAKHARKAAADAPSSSAASTIKLPKPKNAFMMFADDKRASIKEANPGMGVADLSKQLGELWKAMTVEDKQQYVDKAIADKERCAAEIAAMDQEVVAAIRKAEVDKRAAKGGKKGAGAPAAAAATATEAQPPAAGAADEQLTMSKKAANKEALKEAKAVAKENTKEKDAAAASKKAEKAAAKAAAKEAANRRKAAFKCFYTSKYRSFREQSPDASPEDISTQIKDAWEALSEEQQQPFYSRAEEEAEALRAASKPRAQASSSGAASGPKRGRGRRNQAAADEDADEGSEGEEARGDGDTGNDDDSDREDVDWEEHPAAAIIAHTTDGSSLLVQRRGVGLNDYGIVNARKLKQQVMGSASDSEKLPVTTAMLEKYENFKKSFWTAVHKRTCRGAIDMEDLEDGSPLEMCYLLGKLQEENHLCCSKGKPAKNKGTKEEDFLITVPGLKLSMAMQRILNVAREDKATVQQHLRQLLQALEAEDGLSSATKEAAALASSALRV